MKGRYVDEGKGSHNFFKFLTQSIETRTVVQAAIWSVPPMGGSSWGEIAGLKKKPGGGQLFNPDGGPKP